MYLQNVYNLGSDIGGAGRRVDVITQHNSQHTLLSLNNMNEIDYIERLLLLSIHFACFPAALYINTKCAQSSAARFISALVKRWSSFTPRPRALYVSALKQSYELALGSEMKNRC